MLVEGVRGHGDHLVAGDKIGRQCLHLVGVTTGFGNVEGEINIRVGVRTIDSFL